MFSSLSCLCIRSQHFDLPLQTPLPLDFVVWATQPPIGDEIMLKSLAVGGRLVPACGSHSHGTSQ